MKVLQTAATEVFGLFFDDGFLAVGILVWVAAMTWLVPRIPIPMSWMAPLLFLGLAALLLTSVVQSARK